MGNKQTVLTDEILEHYVDTTFLSKQEVLRVFKRFCDILDVSWKNGISSYDDLTVQVAKYSDLCKCPELKENPFRKRICKAFSGASEAHLGGTDGNGLTFDEFVQMYSVFSDRAPRDLKVHYAFLVYDIDGDGTISTGDIEHVVKLLTQNGLTSEEMKSIGDKVLVESDIDDDHSLSFNEFKHVIVKSPDFLSTFHFSI